MGFRFNRLYFLLTVLFMALILAPSVYSAQPADDYGDNCGQAESINVNSETSGSIETAGDKDYFVVTFPSGGTATVYTEGSTDTKGYVWNHNSCNNNSLIAQDNDSGDGDNFFMQGNIAAGTYYIGLKHNNNWDVGDYTLHVDFQAAASDDYGDDCDNAESISVNSVTSGSIETAGDRDFFVVDIPSDGIATVYTTGSTDTVGYVWNRSNCNAGCLIASDDNSGDDDNFLMEGNVTAGTYYIGLKHNNNNDVGDYTLNVVFVSGDSYIITASAGDGGSISPSGYVPVMTGDDQEFTITPDTCYEVEDVLVNGSSVGAVTSHTLANVTSDQTIEASFVMDTDSDITITASAGSNGSISPTGESTLACGGNQAFTIEPDAGFVVEDVLVDGESVGDVTSFSFSEATSSHTIEATFVSDDHGEDCAGSTAVSCAGTMDGEIQTSGSWVDRDYFRLDLAQQGLVTIYTTGSTDTYGYLLNSGCSELTFDNDSGTDSNFSIEQELDAGTYYIIVRHYNSSSTGSYTLNIECATSYTITASAETGGSISPSGYIVVIEGADQTFTISPDSNVSIQDVKVDGASVGAVSSYPFTNITSDHTIVAYFNVPAEQCVDISDVPMDVRRHVAPANIMFVVDDSGSMDWEFMTTEDDGLFGAGNHDYNYLYDLSDRIYLTGNNSYVLTGSNRMLWKSQWHGYNKMYYDPDVDYTPWPTLGNADPDNPRSNPDEATPTLNLNDTFYSLTLGLAGIVIDNEDTGNFSKTFAASIDPSVTIVDNEDGDFSKTGDWNVVSPHDEAYNTHLYETSATGLHTATWTPNLAGGEYDVYGWWRSLGTYSTTTPYTINYSGGSTTVDVDQTTNEAQWNRLGDTSYPFTGDAGENVTISYDPGGGALACADAIKFVLIDGWDWATDSQAHEDHYWYTSKNGDYTATWTPPSIAAGEYNVYARWKDDPDRSSAVPYTITYSGGSSTTVTVDQTSNGGQWVQLGGPYTFDEDSGSVSISLTNYNVSTGGTVCADAVLFVSTASTTVDIKNSHYYVWSTEENKPYLVILDGAASYYEVNDSDGDNLVEEGELWPAVSAPSGVQLSGTYAEERQNFANWFSYYRKRDLTTRAAIAQVINSMQGVQVGFRSINEELIQPVLKVKVGGEDYTSTLLSGLYSYRINAQRAATPLRRGFEDLGKYFDREDGGDDGGVGPSPIASSDEGGECQQNFAVLFTDGYYNGLPPKGVGNEDEDNGLPYADSATNTLADVAMYYYENDLDTTLDNRVPVNPADDATHQHLVTYGVTFGVYGTMNPEEYDLENCTIADCPQWPSPITAQNNKKYKIDDLWHASVNGRGTFLSASNPEELVKAFLEVMQNIESRIGSAASVSVNGDELYGGIGEEVRMFQSSYCSDGWTGDVKAYALNTTTGEVVTTSYVFSAADELENLNWDNDRIIATYDGTTGIPFRATSLTDGQKALLDDTWETSGATDIVNYLRGDNTNNVSNSGNYRDRYQILGDVVHSSPVYKNGVLYAGGNDGMLHAFAASDDLGGNVVGGQELFAYVPNLVFENLKNIANTTYSHNFFVDLSPLVSDVTLTGVTTMLVGGLGKGGKGYYALNISDVSNDPRPFASETDLAARVMWEYPRIGTDDAERNDLGYSFSRPSIVRSNDTTNAEWIVIFGNGYNSQNGHGVLFILNALNGDLIKRIDTEAGSCNGLSSPIPIDINNDGMVDYAYAGDLKGNLWKFDLTSTDYNNWDAAYNDGTNPQPLFQAKGPGGVTQPITTKPDVMFHCEKDGFMVAFGTGRYLGDSDFDDTSTQTIYGVWDYGDDDDDDEYLGSFNRGSTPELSNQLLAGVTVTLLEQEIVPSSEEDTNFWTVNDQKLRVLTNNIEGIEEPWETTSLNSDETECGDGEGSIPCDPDNVGSNPDPVNYAGWYFDLPITGERVINDLMLRDGNVIIVTFTPEQTACGSGGDSIIMEMNACSGGRLSRAQLDINEDGLINDDDLINIGTEEDPIYIAPTGIQKPGRLLPPAILINESEEIKYFSTNVGNIVIQTERAVKIGIVHWIEY